LDFSKARFFRSPLADVTRRVIAPVFVIGVWLTLKPL
jgi:hypothetical protein